MTYFSAVATELPRDLLIWNLSYDE